MENKDTLDKKEGDDHSATGSNVGVPSPPLEDPQSQMGTDIQKILKGVKLPQREEHRTLGDKRLVFDTKAVSMVSAETASQISDGKKIVKTLSTTQEQKAPDVSPAAPAGPEKASEKREQSMPPLPPSFAQGTAAQEIFVPPETLAEKLPHTQGEVALETQGEQKKTLPETGSVTALRTLKEDLQDIIRTKKVSLVRAVALEEEKKRKRDSVVDEIPKGSGRTYGTLLAALIFFVLGGLALYGVFVALPKSGEEEVVAQPALMFREQVTPFLLDALPPGEIKRELLGLRSSIRMTLGAMVQIVPMRTLFDADNKAQERSATLSEFFKALGITAPENLLRALSDDFFFGVHIVDENASLLVIPVDSYERAFTGMLAWEKNMSSDLVPIFTPVPPLTVDEQGLFTWRPFEDIIIRNYDVRALRDDEGTIQLYYSFPTRDILIIAESTYSFTEILSRLRAERRL